MYRLDLGVESPYLGSAYADEYFGKELPRVGLGKGKETAVVGEEDVGKKADDCRMWYVFVFFFDGCDWNAECIV
jgi:hypothetical protein